jgi:hypothetical protein
MEVWLLVLFLADAGAMPIVRPVESLAACRARAPVRAFHLEMTGRPVARVQCVRAPALTAPTGEILVR